MYLDQASLEDFPEADRPPPKPPDRSSLSILKPSAVRRELRSVELSIDH